MIRAGSLLRFTQWAEPSDIRFTILRFDRETDIYYLQSSRGLVDCTLTRWTLHAWLRSKTLTLERKGPS